MDRLASWLSMTKLLPLLLFSLLACAAFRLIFHQSIHQSGLHSKLSAISDPNAAPHPHRIPYTGNPAVDRFLCHLVVFFHALFDLSYPPLLATLFPVVGVVALVPYLEAARDRPPVVLRVPTVVGIAFQLVSMGITMPVYALLFVIAGAPSIQPSATSSSKINQGNAEALLLGLLLGYALPTSLMLFLVRPSVTALWQPFPLLIALTMVTHTVIRPPSRHARSGHPTVLLTLALTLVLSALLHAVYVWPVLTDPAALQTMFVPLGTLDPITSSVEDGVLEFIKWDLIFGAGSVALATLWMADSVLGLVGILVWYGVATVVFGPAAAITSVFLWRERRLNAQRQTDKTARGD